MYSEDVAWIPAQTELIMTTHAVPASIVSLITAYNGGTITEEHLHRFLANPNSVFGHEQEIILIGQIPKECLIVNENPQLPAVMAAGDRAVYWARDTRFPVEGPRFLMVGGFRIPRQDMGTTVQLLGVRGDQAVLKFTSLSNEVSVQVGDELHGPYKNILFSAIDENVLVFIVEEMDERVCTHITDGTHTEKETNSAVADTLKRCRISHCGIYSCLGRNIGLFFIAHEETGPTIFWQSAGGWHKECEPDFYGVHPDENNGFIFCARSERGQCYIRSSRRSPSRFNINGPPINGKFCMINGDPVVWGKTREGDPGAYSLYRKDDIVGFSNDPNVDVCPAGSSTLYSCRDEDGRIKVRFDYNNPIGVHRDLAHLQFVHDRALYAATDDGTNWYVRWGDYRGPLFDEIYSIQETESGIEYVARKRRRLYRVRASY